MPCLCFGSAISLRAFHGIACKAVKKAVRGAQLMVDGDMIIQIGNREAAVQSIRTVYSQCKKHKAAKGQYGSTDPADHGVRRAIAIQPYSQTD